MHARLAFAAAFLCSAAIAQTIDIPYQKFVLDNGLTLIVHEDHKAPIVAINVWYHVGSKNEKPGKTGFAHLFEHLMFTGSENYKDRYVNALESIGATDDNGTTNSDRTNYFENVPTNAVDYALWLESDRMGHFAGAITEDRLNLQRGVVQNEKRQGENQPYGVTEQLITENTYPPGHPYSWTTIGSMEDLNAASLADVKEWFKTYYGPSNAVLVLAGDIDPQTAKQKVIQYFGDIPSGPPVAHQEAWIAKMTGVHRQRVSDRVPQPRIYMIWNTPQFGAADSDYLALVARCLTDGTSSRLYKRLIYDEQIATAAVATQDTGEIGSQFEVEVTTRPSQDLPKVENEINEELTRFLQNGPTEQELQRAKAQYLAGVIRQSERVGGFGGKSDRLAMGEAFTGNPESYKISFERVKQATAADLKAAANRWLSDGVYILDVLPFPNYKTTTTTVTRATPPDLGNPPELKLPKLKRATLSNGLKIVLAERHELPLVNFWLAVDAGYSADQFASPGTAALTATLLNQGTATRNAAQISDELLSLGARIDVRSNLDFSTVHMSALKNQLDPSLALFGDIVLHPAFPDSDFAREQKLQLTTIEREQSNPMAITRRLMPPLLYGANHAYGVPLTGSGTTESVAKLQRADLVKFYDTWFRPNAATLVVVGDITLPEAQAKLEKLFASWKPGKVPAKNVAAVSQPTKPTVYLVDRPGSQQSVIMAGIIAPPKSGPLDIPLDTADSVLGGMFGSRLNMNLREDKHWSYGAWTQILPARAQRPYVAIAPVQTDKTKESLAEMQKEFLGITGAQPITSEELLAAQRNETLTLPGSRETMDRVGDSILNLLQYGLPDNYYETYSAKVRALKNSDLNDAAKSVIDPNHLIWIIVGDRSKIETGIRDLNLGELHLITADGKPQS